MEGRLTPRRIVALIMIVIGIILYYDARDIKSTAESTMSYIMSPTDKLLNNPESFSNFDEETYLNTSVAKIAGLSVDGIQFVSEAEAGVGAIFVGGILLFVRTMEWEKNFYKKVGSFFLP